MAAEKYLMGRKGRLVKKPLVSIVIPSYNSKRTLAACIESALAQDYLNKEVIVVDDASSDASLAVAMRYVGRGVKVLRNRRNKGLAATLNKGMRYARGEFVLVLQDDCVLVGTDWLSRALGRFREKRIAGVSGKIVEDIRGMGFWDRIFRVLDRIAAASDAVEEVPFIENRCSVYAGDALMAAGGFSESYSENAGEDQDLCYHLREKGFRFVLDRSLKAIHDYTVHQGSFLGDLRHEALYGRAAAQLALRHPLSLAGNVSYGADLGGRSRYRASIIAFVLLFLAFAALLPFQFQIGAALLAMLAAARILYFAWTCAPHIGIIGWNGALVFPFVGLLVDFIYFYGGLLGALESVATRGSRGRRR